MKRRNETPIDNFNKVAATRRRRRKEESNFNFDFILISFNKVKTTKKILNKFLIEYLFSNFLLIILI